MNTYAFVIKAKAKSERKNLFCWLSAKSDSRAEREILNILDDADIAVGRGADYQLPQRTDWHVADDLPEEGLLDDTWCDRYTLGEDGRSWSPVLGEEKSINTQDENDSGQDDGWTSIRELFMPQQIAAAWLFDQQHIDRQQLSEVKEAVLSDSSETLSIVVAALTDPAVVNITGGVTAGVIRAIRQVWPEGSQDNMTADLVRQFACTYTTATEEGRNHIVQSWIESQKAPVEGPETADDAASGHQNYSYNQRVLGTWLFGLFNELSAEQSAEITRVSLDMDASYPQNVLLACRNEQVRQLQHVFPETLAELFAATQSIWSVDGLAPQLAQLVSFFKEWIEAHNSNSSITAPRKKIDRDGVTAKWLKKAGKTTIQRTDTGANAGGGNPTDRNPDLKHTLDTLDIEIAAALLPMDYNIYEIPGGVLRRAKEIIANKEEPWNSWSTQLRKTPGILDFSRAAVFVLIRNAPEGIHKETPKLISYIAQNGKEVAFIPDTGNDDSEARWQAIESMLITPAAASAEEPASEEVDSQLANTTHVMPKWVKTEEQQIAEDEGNKVHTLPKCAAAGDEQPKVESLGGGVFSIEGLLATPSNEVAKQEADSVSPADILAAAAPELASNVAADQDQIIEPLNQAEPELPQTEPETPVIEPEADIPEPEAAAQQWPAYFEPGRYEGLPNHVYHAANGISSTMVKDARVSLMYFEARHVSKTIQKERSKVLDMGNLVHALALQPETLAAEFSIEPEIPEGALTTTATIRACIDEYNASLPSQLSAEDIKAFLEAHNATLPAPLPLGAAVDETAESYMALPEEFQRIEADKKQTAAAMKACIKEYNATLPAQAKTSGSRDALLEQLAIVNPDLVAQEAQKLAPLKVSGTKTDLIQALKAVRPDAVFADELLDAWRENPEGKVLVTRQQLETALAIQKALHAHQTAGKLLLHPDRAVETSYFGIDEETGLEIRVRPDLELDVDGIRIGADLKTISMWNIKQSGLRAKLHREIIDRDYHLSAGMYMETASLDQFFWIFVNKDEGYHWIAIVEASPELVELGILEYRATMRAIANAFDTGEWPAPITNDYTDELTDYDLRRLEALRTA